MLFAYPNPSADGLFSIMDATSSNPIVEGAVYDLQGREVSSYDYTREAIRLNQQPAGLYIFRYVRAGGQTGSMRLMRQ